MWLVKTSDDLIFKGNRRSDLFMIDVLRDQFPGATIYRSVDECVGEFCALAFAQKWVSHQVNKTNDEGMEYTETFSELEPAGNTFELNGLTAIVRDKMGAVLGSFEMEIAHDGNTAN